MSCRNCGTEECSCDREETVTPKISRLKAENASLKEAVCCLTGKHEKLQAQLTQAVAEERARCAGIARSFDKGVISTAQRAGIVVAVKESIAKEIEGE